MSVTLSCNHSVDSDGSAEALWSRLAFTQGPCHRRASTASISLFTVAAATVLPVATGFSEVRILGTDRVAQDLL